MKPKRPKRRPYWKSGPAWIDSTGRAFEMRALGAGQEQLVRLPDPPADVTMPSKVPAAGKSR